MSLGESVAIVEQTNANGIPINTDVLSTLTTASGTSTSSSDDGNGGPVGYTTSSNNGPAPPTTYVFTTTDLFGSKTLVTTVFTPTYMPTKPWPTPSAGSIIAYSQWTVDNPATSSGASHRTATSVSDTGLLVIIATVVGAMIGGLNVLA
ncbi:hypothetical protein DL93DRAFT_2082653 [Clavulina sp. PMI_390]|nr:hypothetical protein DL93DRAFT_2082653 [Clavulina sp. PMI_390]